MNPWLVLAMLSPVLLLLALYSIVVIVALLRADVKDVPSVLDVGVTVYEKLATQRLASYLRASQVVDRTGTLKPVTTTTGGWNDDGPARTTLGYRPHP